MISIFNFTINLKHIILPIIYIFVGIIAQLIIKKFIEKVLILKKGNLNKAQNQKIKTIKTVILNLSKYIISILIILAILSVYGVNVKSILAGLGIGTAIIGLAFQDLAKDIIAGIFIIIEDQYEVGDTIEIDGFMGEVTFVGLKTTRIKNYKGAVKIISNRNMDKIINYSLNNSLAIVDVGVSYDHSPKEVEEVLEKMFTKIEKNIDCAVSPFKIMGINELDSSSVIYRISIEVEPMKHIDIERYIKREIKIAFDEANIKIPYPQIEVHNGKK